MELRKLLQEFVNTPYEKLLGMASVSLEKLMPIFNSFQNDGNGARAAVVFISCCYAADGKFTDLEYKFLCDLIGNVDKETVTGFINSCTPEIYAMVDQLIDSLDSENKAAMLTLLTCFLAVDETITAQETALIKKLIEA